jgi:hypothetical protein
VSVSRTGRRLTQPRKCYACGGFLPWVSWSAFWTANKVIHCKLPPFIGQCCNCYRIRHACVQTVHVEAEPEKLLQRCVALGATLRAASRNDDHAALPPLHLTICVRRTAQHVGNGGILRRPAADYKELNRAAREAQEQQAAANESEETE